MTRLAIADLFRIVRAAGAQPGADACAVAGALAESGGDTEARGDVDAQGVAHSIGIWQMHDRGLGAGMTAAARTDPAQTDERTAPRHGPKQHVLRTSPFFCYVI